MSRYKNGERNAEIIRRRMAGELPSDIRRAMGVSRNVVAGVLDRAGIILGGQPEGCRKYANPPRGSKCHAAILTEEDVEVIRADYRKGARGEKAGSKVALAKQYGVVPRTIWQVATGRTWKHVA